MTAETLTQMVQRLRNGYTVEVKVKKTGHSEDGNPEFKVLLKHVIPTEDGDELVDDYECYYVIVDRDNRVLRHQDEHQKFCAHND